MLQGSSSHRLEGSFVPTCYRRQHQALFRSRYIIWHLQHNRHCRKSEFEKNQTTGWSSPCSIKNWDCGAFSSAIEWAWITWRTEAACLLRRRGFRSDKTGMTVLATQKYKVFRYCRGLKTGDSKVLRGNWSIVWVRRWGKRRSKKYRGAWFGVYCRRITRFAAFESFF